MRTRPLGERGPDVSIVGLGTNNFGGRTDLTQSRAVIDAALDEGISLIDTADIYGDTQSERFLGEVLAGRRDRVQLLTKFGYLQLEGGPELPRGSRDYLRFAIEGSLERLKTDVVDVYMYHRPDGATPIAETIGFMGELVHEGKARYIAVSNVDVSELEEASAEASRSGIPLVAVENRFSLLRHEADDDVIPACERHGLSFLPYYPLEGGLLTGKYARGGAPPAGSRFAGNPNADTWLTEEAFDKVEAVSRFADERGLSLLEVAIGYLAALPAVASVIAGATTPEQVRANAAAAVWQPTSDDLVALRSLVS